MSVSATGPAPYGVIGSAQPQDRQYVMAAGVYSERNLAGAACVLEGVEVSVRAVCALSNYALGNSTVCAAGAVSGHYQSNLRLGYTTVTVAESILSEAVSGSGVSEVYSFGLAYDAYAFRECSVSVGGSVQAIAAEGVSASGFAHQPYDEPNVLDQNVDYENCSVTAGSISAVSPEYGGYAAGFMRWCYGACKNCSVTAGSIESSGIDADVSGFAPGSRPTPRPTSATRTASSTAARSPRAASAPSTRTPTTPQMPPASSSRSRTLSPASAQRYAAAK